MTATPESHVVDAAPLDRLIRAVLEAAGASSAEAATVAHHLVWANLAGHDSHGVQLLPGYVANIRRGHTVPGARVEVLDETPATARVDGHWGFGQVVSERAMTLAIEKARAGRVASVTVARQAHVGRVAGYPLMAARAGLIGIMFCDSGKTAKPVVPFGGREGRPSAASAPRRSRRPASSRRPETPAARPRRASPAEPAYSTITLTRRLTGDHAVGRRRLLDLLDGADLGEEAQPAFELVVADEGAQQLLHPGDRRRHVTRLEREREAGVEEQPAALTSRLGRDPVGQRARSRCRPGSPGPLAGAASCPP